MVQFFINYFRADGLAHIIVCSVIVSLLSLIIPVWIAIAVTATIGIGKELIWDKLLHRGSFEVKDLIADCIGIILGII